MTEMAGREARERVRELEAEMAKLGAELLEAREAALSPEFVERRERQLAEAWDSGRYEHLDLDAIELLLQEAYSERREKLAVFKTTLIADVRIAQLEAAKTKEMRKRDALMADLKLGTEELGLVQRLYGLPEDRVRRVVEAAGELRRDAPAEEDAEVERT